MNNGHVSTVKIAATFIGTVVGAGFASGQETLRFFLIYGYKGLWGLALVTILFMVFGYIIMNLGRDLHSQSQIEIIQYASGKSLGTIIDYIITFFLFGALTAMIAGAGAVLAQQFNISSLWGNIIMGVITALTVMTGIKGVINSISIVVPFLIISVLGISILSLIFNPASSTNMEIISNVTVLKGNWLWSAILYTSYNIVLSIAVLGTLGNNARNRISIRNGAILGGLGLGLGAIAIYFAMSNNIIDVIDKEVPMIYIAGRISYIIQLIYAVVLIAEIYTTAVGSLYSLTSRIVGMQKANTNYFIIATSVAALIASQFGFSNLVQYFYPIMGYGGILLLVCLIYKGLKRI